jgi:LacI family transcriptional regulator
MEDRCYSIDNERAAYDATTYLLGLGHRWIAHIAGPLQRLEVQQRIAGYQRALEAHEVFDEALLVEGDYNEQTGLLSMETLLTRNQRFTAVFAANDQMAHGARLALYRRGIRVPEDVSLMGFDDLPTARFSIPPLSTVRQPMLEMGEAAARGVLALLMGKSAPRAMCEHELVIRESTRLLR